MQIDISHETFVTALAGIQAQQLRKPDLRNIRALTELREAFNKETQREIDAVRELPPTPAMVRKQAG